MKLTTAQLAQHCQQSLAPIYLISGDEPLLVAEAKRMLLKYAKEKGFDSAQRISITAKFNWDELQHALRNYSLFNPNNLIVLHSDHLKFGRTGSALLQQIAQGNFTNCLVLLLTPKCDQASQRSAWFKAILAQACFIPIWPINAQQWPHWLRQKLQRNHLDLEPSAFTLLCEHTTSQVLAATQLVEQLRLSYGHARVSKEQLSKLLCNRSHYDIFQLCDAALAGQAAQAQQILLNLEHSGVEATLVLWALSRDIRSLIQITSLQNQDQTLTQAFKAAGVWQQRQSIMKQALQHTDLITWHQCLRWASRIDRIIKGLCIGYVWDELSQLCLTISRHKALHYATL